MVLKSMKIYFVIILLGVMILPCNVFACDPNSQPEVMTTLSFEPLLSPATIFLILDLFFIRDIVAPHQWDSVMHDDTKSLGLLSIADTFLFHATSLLAKRSTTEIDKLKGRALLSISPVMVRLSRDALSNGIWQTIIVLVSLPISAKLVTYKSDGKISFIDEVDSTVNFSLTCSWPPVLLKHLSAWNSAGLLFSWELKDLNDQVAEGGLME